MVICRSKSDFYYEAAKLKLTDSLKRNFFRYGREWAYKNICPQIIAEQYLESPDNDESVGLIDYKFYCFNGSPRFLYVSKGLENHATAKMIYLDLAWKPMQFQREDYARFSVLPDRPAKLCDMVKIAETLSKDIPFLRVDLYEVNGEIYFSELTLYPGSGLVPFKPDYWEKELGNWIVLPDKTPCKM